MGHDELNRLIMSSSCSSAPSGRNAAAVGARIVAASVSVAIAAEAIAETTKAGSILVKRGGADDHAPNTHGQMNQGEEDDDGVESDQSRDELARVFSRDPLASGAIISPLVQLLHALLDRLLIHIPSVADSNDTAATFQEGQQAAEDGQDEKSDDALVTSGFTGRVTKVGDGEEEWRRDDGRSICNIHPLVSGLETPNDDGDDGDVGTSRESGDQRMKDGVDFNGTDGQGMIE